MQLARRWYHRSTNGFFLRARGRGRRPAGVVRLVVDLVVRLAIEATVHFQDPNRGQVGFRLAPLDSGGILTRHRTTSQPRHET